MSLEKRQRRLLKAVDELLTKGYKSPKQIWRERRAKEKKLERITREESLFKGQLDLERFINIKRFTKMPRAIVRFSKKHVSILCDQGHLLDSHKLGPRSGFAGSNIEAEISFRHKGDRLDRLARACLGAGHKRRRKKR